MIAFLLPYFFDTYNNTNCIFVKQFFIYSMSFIQSFSIETDKQNPFPFNIPAVKFAKNIVLNNGVTIFVGDNGSGKSTLLETLAYKLNLALIGGYIKANNRAGFDAAEALQPSLKINWKRETNKGFFFRAEDFSDFINAVETERNKIYNDLSELKGAVDDSIIDEMTNNANFYRKDMRRQYGTDMQAFSHGEAYLEILQTRIGDKGIFLLDEPEAALSPLKQLSLMSLIMDIVKNKNAQFIISTHSPVLMGLPGATLYQIQDESMQEVTYNETDHYRITKTFLDNPEYYLRHL
jgi:predicted ATPase